MNWEEDTIAAIATPIGEGGIGIIRISGRSALTIAADIFQTVSGVPPPGLPTHTAHYGFVVDPITEERVDDGVLTVYRKPRSYTGEDSVEISCHAGMVPMRRVLEAALKAGARLAEPGEFTKRAFLNGRLDLAQAEAVLDIIRARTDDALRVARQQFEGALSYHIRSLRQELIGILANIEAAIDFPDDVEEYEPKHIAQRITDAINHVNSLLETADQGKVYREGVRVVITGRPNVGKSSLLNALLRESRAIVTPIPGTTRDVIEETINIRGIPVNAIDTAGLRETENEVELIGVERARQMIECADLILAVVDGEAGFTQSDEELFSVLAHKKLIGVVSKSDLVRDEDSDAVAQKIIDWTRENLSQEICIVKTAAPSNEGIEKLEDAIAEAVLSGNVSHSDSVVVSNIRHRLALEDTRNSLSAALRTANSNMPLDLATVDLKIAVESLGSITGETVTEDVIERIFSEFCIGK